MTLAGARLHYAAPWIALIAMAIFAGHTAVVLAQTRTVVLPEPHGTAVGLAVVLNSGSAWEIESESGLACLAARSIAEDTRGQLDALGGQIAIECDPASIRFTLLFPRQTWQTGAEVFLRTLFDHPVSESSLDAARAAVLRDAVIQDGNFIGQIRAALAESRFGSSHRWARPSLGRPETLARLGVDDVRRIVRTRFTPLRATAAIAGPVDSIAGREVLSRYLSESNLPVLVPSPTPLPGQRFVVVAGNTVTEWIGLAFPFHEVVDVDALRLLGHHVLTNIAPSPSRPEVFDAAIEFERHGDGGHLIVYLVTAPGRSAAWIERIEGIIRDAGEDRLPKARFEDLKRRFMGAHLLELSTPEARARDAALQLYFEHTYRSPEDRITAVTATRVRRAAASLGEPAVAVLGPR